MNKPVGEKTRAVAGAAGGMNRKGGKPVVVKQKDDSAADADAAENAGCDRRLSRAARSILLEKFRAASQRIIAQQQQLSGGGGGGGGNTNEDVNLWRFMDTFVKPVAAAAAVEGAERDGKEEGNNRSSFSCPLQSQLDVWKDHEMNSLVQTATDASRPFSASITGVQGFTSGHFARLHRRGTSSSQLQPLTYQCLYCQKVFSSRYYLDLHQATQHHQSSTNTTLHNNDNKEQQQLCPATDWCQFLPPTACQLRALQDEPYYGPGSDGRRQDRYKVEAALWKQAHAVPCTVAAARAAETVCRQVGESCFVSSSSHYDMDEDRMIIIKEMKEYWQHQVCHKAFFSCPNRLQQLYLKTQVDGDLMLRQVHEWQDEWAYWYEEHHTLGWMGSILLTGVVIYYSTVAYQKWQYYQRSHRPGPRLLRGAKAKRH